MKVSSCVLTLLLLCPAYSVDPNDQKKTACYDIDVEVDDPLKAQMSNFLASTTNQQEIASLDVKVGPLPLQPSLGPKVGVDRLLGIFVCVTPGDGICESFGVRPGNRTP